LNFIMATPTRAIDVTLQSRNAIERAVPSRADKVSLSKIASLGRGVNSGVSAKPGESRRDHGLTFSGSSVRCQAIAMR
jgi:hypothetical protein